MKNILFQSRIESDYRVELEQFRKDEEIFDGKQKPDDTLITTNVQTEQHFVNQSSGDYKDENLIDDDMLKQDVFLRGIRSNQNKWWERENDYFNSEAKNSSFQLEKLLSPAGRSTYLMHFVNFNGRENVLIELLVRTANILINNKD